MSFNIANASGIRTVSPIYRDKMIRWFYKEFEIKRLFINYVSKNESFPSSMRYRAFILYETFPRWANPNRIRNRCALTGRPRAVDVKGTRLSRLEFRKQFSNGMLNGWRQSQW